jgi:ABC-type nitrate/sulfonate/bicarbonate transport system substrate-binding protein
MRRTLLLIILAVYLPAHPAPAQQKFLMGYSSFSSNQIPLWVAKDEGLFKRYGTDPDLILIEGGTRGGQALISGDVPVMGMSGQPVISARARGADLVMIAGVVNKITFSLARHQSGNRRISKANGSARRRPAQLPIMRSCSV